MNAPAVIDPELSLLSRFLAWCGSPVQAGEILVRIAPNPWGGISLYPVNPAAWELMGGDEPTGNFATEADARKRAAWNAWEVVPEGVVFAAHVPASDRAIPTPSKSAALEHYTRTHHA